MNIERYENNVQNAIDNGHSLDYARDYAYGLEIALARIYVTYNANEAQLWAQLYAAACYEIRSKWLDANASELADEWYAEELAIA